MGFFKNINKLPFGAKTAITEGGVKLLGKEFFSKKDHFILHNRFVLYFIFLLSLVDLFYLMNEQDWFSITVFFIVGTIIFFFDKNMLVVLFVALTFTNAIKYGTDIQKNNDNFSVCG